ncbi:hypothetical protein B0H14DRAFT_2583455 [Mycena olivaceomarginata]|nr:hypothetical protein B0H14DRAFT_2583455 [Mycena olivaceomarginata]
MRWPSFCLFKLTRPVDPSTAVFDGTAVKNAAKEPTERYSMPVAGPRRTGTTGTACSPIQVCQQAEGMNSNKSGFRALPAEFNKVKSARPFTRTQGEVNSE